MRQRRGGRKIGRSLALLFGLALAIAATVALVLTTDTRTLRLAVIGALWAFLIAAFVAGQRRGTDSGPGSEVELRRSYELELEREVAARREYELKLEVQLRREIEGALREDVAALRGDVSRLRHDILERWDGELRVERVAVRAESTRVSGGFGATFHALQDEARRLRSEGRPLFEVEEARVRRGDPDEASTVEFSVVPAAPDAGPPPTARPAVPAPPASVEPAPAEPPRRHRYRIDDDGDSPDEHVDASAVLQRVLAESSSGDTSRRDRRRYREDDETDDVLARVLGRT